MPKDLKINDVIYNGIDSLTVPDVNGRPAVFRDTGDATATAADVLSGATFYGSNGIGVGTLVLPEPGVSLDNLKYAHFAGGNVCGEIAIAFIDGMTWGELVESGLCPGFYVVDIAFNPGLSFADDGRLICSVDGNEVMVYDTLIGIVTENVYRDSVIDDSIVYMKT